MSIETSTRCSCGTHVTLTQGNQWEALCPTCYGPVEDSSDREKVRGVGDYPLEALSDWQEKHDEAWGVTLVVTDLFGELARQVSEESERQRGWAVKLHTNLFSDWQVKPVKSPDVMLRGPAAWSSAEITYGPEAP